MRAILAAEAPELGVEVDSAGTHGYHVGEPPDARTAAAARRRGIVLDALRARQVREEDYSVFDLIVAMDENNLATLRARAPAGSRAQLHLFMDFAPDAGIREVPDPYYGGANGFEEVLDLAEAAARGLLQALREGRLPSA